MASGRGVGLQGRAVLTYPRRTLLAAAEAAAEAGMGWAGTNHDFTRNGVAWPELK